MSEVDTDLLESAIADLHTATFAEKPRHCVRLAIITTALGISCCAAGELVRAALYMSAAASWGALGVTLAGAVKRWPWLGDMHRRDIVLHTTNVGPVADPERRAFIRAVDEGLNDLAHARRRRQ